MLFDLMKEEEFNAWFLYQANVKPRRSRKKAEKGIEWIRFDKRVKK